MALWLVRAGSNGEYEKKFLDENRIYLTWDGLSRDLSQITGLCFPANINLRFMWAK